MERKLKLSFDETKGLKDLYLDKLKQYFANTGDNFGDFIQTALATQPLSSINSATELYFHSMPKFIRMQKDDGSFGDSVTFTAMALPSLAHITSSELNAVECLEYRPRTVQGNHTIKLSYVMQDKVITDQRTTGHFYVPKGSRLIDALNAHSKLNPHTFQIDINAEGLVTKILSWNKIENRENLQAYWKVEKDIGNKRFEDITEQLEKEFMNKDMRYVMSFVTKQ